VKSVLLLGNLTLDVTVDSDIASTSGGRQVPAVVEFATGGGAANVAKALDRLKCQYLALGACGTDPAGQIVSAMTPWHVTKRARASTEISVVMTRGERTILNSQGTANLSLPTVLGSVPDEGLLVIAYLNCCGLRPSDVPRVVQRATARRSTVVAGLNGVFSRERRRVVRAALPNVSLLVLNELEALWLTGTSTISTATAWLVKNRIHALVTLGASGAVHIHGPRIENVRRSRVKARRTLGAGDAFLAGVSHGLADGESCDGLIDSGFASAGQWVQALDGRS
jgi:ribokinase